MDPNLILGWSILTLAVIMSGFLAVILLTGNKVGERLTVSVKDAVPVRRGSFQLENGRSVSIRPADCYYKCMSDFRWSTDWVEPCGEACSTGTQLQAKLGQS